MKKYYRPDIQQQRQDILNRMYGFTHGPNFVYALVKNIERKRSPIYVGETVDPRRRFQQHLKVAYGGREDHSVVGKLERRIVASGGKLEMYCLEACQNRISALSKEAAWARALSIRLDQAVFGVHIRSALTNAFAVSMSLRMTATMATFAGFPTARRASYLALRSGLWRIATSAGM